MAKIKLGGLAQDVRGALNGTVFSRNRAGAYVRAKVSPCQPITQWNSAARAMFKAVSQRWPGALSDSQRAAWNAFAALHTYTDVFGDALVLSGIAIYMAINRSLRQVAADWIDDPPATFVSADLGDCVITFVGGTPDIPDASIACGRTLEYGEGLYVFATPPGPWTRTAQQPDYRLVNSQQNGLIADSEDFAGDLISRFPSAVWTPGLYTNIRIAALNSTTGAMSNPVALKVLLA